jgi:DeoR/GlpR family transcriptional regulator of sugar metabolism
VLVKKAMIEASAKMVSLTISEKINTTQPIKVCEANEIDLLITELNEDDKLLKSFRKLGIKIL